MESFRGGAGTEVPVKVSHYAAEGPASGRSVVQCRQAVPGDDVHAVRAGNHHHVVPAGLQHVHDVPPNLPGRPRYRDPCHGVFSFRFVPIPF